MIEGNKKQYDLDALPANLHGCVLAIGNFDGVHLGHRRIIATARAIGEAASAPVVAMTLEPPPDRILHPSDAPLRITPPDLRRALLLEAGADAVVTARVDAAFLSAPAEDFVARIIVGKLAAGHVVEGPFFFFGRSREGDVEFLRNAGVRHGFAVHIVEPVPVEIGGRNERISSSLIRRQIIAGDVEAAQKCLGRPFILCGTVVRGEGRGRALDFPTANLQPDDQIVPADGVYAGRAEIEGDRFLAAISIGNKPTITTSPNGKPMPGQSAFMAPDSLQSSTSEDATRDRAIGPRVIEAFLLDAEGDFYDKHMALSFTGRLRSQRRFGDIGLLRAQIAKDVQRVRELLK